MIEFYKDNLVPPELCRMLYEAVPKEHHVPVRFHNRRRKDVYGESGHYPAGSVGVKRRKKPSHIDINLNPIYEAGQGRSKGRESFSALAPSSALWRLLVEICLHEFGHVATKEEMFRMNQHEYYHGDGSVYDATERLADEWRDHRIAKILKIDPRLGQPRYMSGYLGARLIKWKKVVKDAPGYYPFIMERRCQMTGGQLTAGDVLRKLNIQHHSYKNAYALLREASKGIGVDYVDRAGRHHKLYTWGEIPLLAERFDRAKLREIDQERVFERAMQKFLQEEEMAGSLAM
ncbi:MAG: hypothetical protein M3Q60_13825 [Actinomycetota bacterium]|nr:hypothetical protein [Actinomycetota bacterium]